MSPAGQTIGQMATASAESFGSLAAFSTETIHLSYADLFSRAHCLAASLFDIGIRPDDGIAFQLPNWIEAAVINVAASLLGATCVPIVSIYRDAEVRGILTDSGAKAFFYTRSYRGFDYDAMLHRISGGLGNTTQRIPVRGERSKSPSYESLIESGRTLHFTPPCVDLNACKVIMYTSGTTGAAKGVMHNHLTLTRIMRSCCEKWNIGRGDVVLMPSPVTHTTGYANGLELPFVVGTHTLLMERWDAAAAVDLIESRYVAMMIGATPFLTELLAEAQRRNSRLESLRIFACGGASIPADLIERANAQFENAHVFRVYGSTEAPLVTLGYLGRDELSLACRTDGEIGDYNVKVVDEDGQPVRPGLDGEICVRGPCLFIGYTNAKQTGESFDAEGFFRTGDVGHVTPERAILITDRKKDLIIRGGEKLSAREIEEVLLTHPGISDVAAVRMPHVRLGETTCAYVVNRPGHAITLEEIHRFMTVQGFARQKFPECLRIVAELPRTASGKVRKDVLRERILMEMDQAVSES